MVATVALVYKTGGDYFLEYVGRLAESVRKHGAKDVVCLSDDAGVSIFCKYIPLRNNYTGWWSKLELFRLKGPVVYFDLDTVINGNIRPILKYPHRFTMLRGFGKSRFNSSLMGWSGDYSYLLNQFRASKIREYKRAGKWGDQDWITDHSKESPECFQDLFPGMIVSRKKNHITDRMKASVICYHGKPRPHETGWSI